MEIKIPKWCHSPSGTLISRAELPPTKSSIIPVKRSRYGLCFSFSFSHSLLIICQLDRVKTGIHIFKHVQAMKDIYWKSLCPDASQNASFSAWEFPHSDFLFVTRIVLLLFNIVMPTVSYFMKELLK